MLKELEWLISIYRQRIKLLRSRTGDPRNGGLDEHEWSKQAGILNGVIADLEGMIERYKP